MTTALPLNKMTMSDKISAMELLWDDIIHHSPDFPSPSWHGEILKEREKLIKKGEATFEDWREVKQELWNELT